MTDIALCTDTSCPSRDRCRRATTPAQERQVYAGFRSEGQERCEYYLEPHRLELPWPPAELSPNKRLHWAKRSKSAKAYRFACRLLTRQSGIVAPEGRVLLALEFVPPDRRRRDDDNILAAFKAGRDGIADALGIDDSRFVAQHELRSEPVTAGAVFVRIEPFDRIEQLGVGDG